MRSVLTAGIPQITASTARRSRVRRARSSAERFCPCDDVIVQISASAERIDPFIAQTPAGTRLFEISTTLASTLVENRKSRLDIAMQQPLACRRYAGRWEGFAWDRPNSGAGKVRFGVQKLKSSRRSSGVFQIG